LGCNEPDILSKFRIFGEIPEKNMYKQGYVMKDFVERFVPKNDINQE